MVVLYLCCIISMISTLFEYTTISLYYWLDRQTHPNVSGTKAIRNTISPVSLFSNIGSTVNSCSSGPSNSQTSTSWILIRNTITTKYNCQSLTMTYWLDKSTLDVQECLMASSIMTFCTNLINTNIKYWDCKSPTWRDRYRLLRLSINCWARTWNMTYTLSLMLDQVEVVQAVQVEVLQNRQVHWPSFVLGQRV